MKHTFQVLTFLPLRSNLFMFVKNEQIISWYNLSKSIFTVLLAKQSKGFCICTGIYKIVCMKRNDGKCECKKTGLTISFDFISRENKRKQTQCLLFFWGKWKANLTCNILLEKLRKQNKNQNSHKTELHLRIFNAHHTFLVLNLLVT